MNRTKESMTGRLMFILLAIVVNGLILALMPRLSGQEQRRETMPLFDPIFLADYQPQPEPPPPTRERPEPEEKMPENLPKVSFKQEKVAADRPQIAFDMPAVNFEINPMLATQMAIAPPPPAPVAEIREVPRVSAPAAVQAPPSEFDMEEVDEKPQIISKVEPLYPYRAKRRNLDGKVVVKFLVSDAGDVRKPSVIEAEPSGIFEENTLQAIRRWRFKPGYYKGKPVATWVILPIHFKLSG